jgi:membrane-associated phospholipid phosphatase
VSRRSAALLLAAAFGTLAGLVAAGTVERLDQWAVDHAMPGAHLTSGRPTVADALVPLRHVHWHGALHVFTELVTVPAAFTPATVLLVLACLALPLVSAAIWAAVYVFGNAVEELTKTTLTRPTLHAHAVHVAAFDNSYPSGHTIRSVLLAGVVAAAWPRLRFPAAIWAACTIVLLEIGGLHVPSDLVGGLLLAIALVLVARGVPGAPAS